MMKKVIGVVMICIMTLGLTACVDSDKQDRLLQYLNEDMKEAYELESEANEFYEANIGQNYKSDQELYDVLIETVIPDYEVMLEDARSIDLSKYSEIAEINNLVIQTWNIKKSGFEKIVTSLEQQDSSMLDEANSILEEAISLQNTYSDKLEKLAKEYEVELMDK